MENQPTLNSLGYYLLIWIGQNLAVVGSFITQFSLIWYVTLLTGDPDILNTLSMASFLPLIIIMVFAGIFSDMSNRKILLILLTILNCAITLLFILFTTYGITGIDGLILLTILQGIVQAFFLPTIFSIMPTMVPQPQLGRINGLTYFVMALMQVFGPQWATNLLTHFTITHIYWGELVMIGISLIPLLLIKIPRIQPLQIKTLGRDEESFMRRYLHQGVAGIKSLLMFPGFFIIFGSYILIHFLLNSYSLLNNYYFSTVHSGTPLEYALIFGLSSFIMMLVSIIAIIIKYWKPAILIFFLSAFLIMLGYIILAFAPYRALNLLFIVDMIILFFFMVTQIIFLSIMQTNIPKRHLGQVYGIYLTVFYLAILLSSYETQFLTTVFNARTIFFLCSVIGITLFVALFALTRLLKIKYENYAELPLS